MLRRIGASIAAITFDRAKGTEHDTERDQAVVRLCIAAAVAGYILTAIGFGVLTPGAAIALLFYMAGFFVVAIALLAAITHRPGVKHWRRAVAMINDYLGITAVLTLGGEAVLPVYAALLWVTVGYGMRYGPRYLRAATVCAVLTIATTTLLSDFWHAQPFMVATFVLTALLVPAYAQVLLTHTRLAHDAALAANRAKSRFLAQASHDLRQPVHAIGLFTDCLRSAPLGPDEQQMVDRIERSLQSISRLFRSLFDVSTLDSGRVAPKREVVALGEVLGEVVGQNSEAARWAGVELRLVPTRLRVLADAGLLATIVQNLVSNALKYAPDCPVLVGCRRRGDAVAIEVHDRGRGIAAEHLPNVFDEFYRVQEPGLDIDGVGLGLSIVQRMARLMQLRVTIRSEVGRGTSVAVNGLPLAPAGPGETASFRRRPTPLDGLRILLIEDDCEVREATTALLAKWGCVVQAEAAAPRDGCVCDLIVADLDLGGAESGRDAIELVRRTTGAAVPAILVTGHEALRARADPDDDMPILAKPVRPAELRAAIAAQWLDRKG